MPDIIDTFALSYGPAGQPQGTVNYNADTAVFTLRGQGATTYRIQGGVGSDLADGLLSIEYGSTGFFPLYRAQVGATDSAGTYLGLNAGAYTPLSASADGTTGTIVWRVNIDGTNRTLTATLTVVGEAVKVHYSSTSTSPTANFNGVYGGAFSGDSVRTLEISGTLAFPTAYRTLNHSTLWMGHFLDVSQSGAQGFVLSDPAGGDLTSSYQTAGYYSANTAGVLPSVLDETLWCIAAEDDRDAVRVHSNAASSRHTELGGAVWCYGSSKGDAWAGYESKVSALFTEWGFDRLNFTPQWWCWAPNWTTLSQDNGSDHVPGDPTGHASFGAALTALGGTVSTYAYPTLEKEGTTTYDAERRVLKSDGDPRPGTFAAGIWMTDWGQVSGKFDAEFDGAGGLVEDLSLGGIFFDVDTFVTPFAGGGGNYVNADAASSTQTLATAIRAGRAWMYHCRDTVGGWAAGEGPQAGYTSDFAILYEGCIDAVEGPFCTNATFLYTDSNYPDGRSPAQWPMDLGEFWNRRGKAAQDVWTHPDRCFTPNEIELLSGYPEDPQLYPYTEAMMDLRRCLQLLTRRPGEVYLAASTWGTLMHEPDVVKEHYLTTMISRRASALYATDATIHYHDATQGYETFDERFTRQESIGAGRGRTSMVEPRARIAVGTLTYWINRGDSDWTISAAEAPLSGGGVTLPTNGWLVLDSSDGAIFGSFEADFTGGTRIDVGYVPGEFTLVDGRGTELTAFGVTSTSGRLTLEHYSGDFALAEDGSQEVQRTALTVAAATVEQDTEVAMPYLEHQTASASPEHVTSAYSTSPSA